MKPDSIFGNYELIADRAERAFRQVAQEYPDQVRCKVHCEDCCHAVFGLFLIEAAYIRYHFDQLDPKVIKDALLRCNVAERGLKRLEVKLQRYEDDPEMQAYVFASERIRCPLLDEKSECIVYEYRPITCRVYGIPTKVRGKTRICSRSGFEKNKTYKGFDLDRAFSELFFLSKQFLADYGKGDPEKAALLVSVPRVLTTPLDLLIDETFV